MLEGEGAECALDGLFVGGGAQHVDNHTAIDHAVPHGTSRELYKGVLDGAARGVFTGRVDRAARRAEDRRAAVEREPAARRDGAEIDTKPQLEIYADDVKCSHGATIGQLDEDALFYLRSRGIGRGSARATC